jgi:hypothetical protein
VKNLKKKLFQMHIQLKREPQFNITQKLFLNLQAVQINTEGNVLLLDKESHAPLLERAGQEEESQVKRIN